MRHGSKRQRQVPKARLCPHQNTTMKRRVITFTVQIQADMFERPGKKETIATGVCDDINRILISHEEMVGAAQIMSTPKAIKIESPVD